METPFRFSSTYLFKIHDLKNSLDKAFDQVLQNHAHITLSQFTLLLAIAEHPAIHQRAVARFLGISPAAVNRQVEIARKQRRIQVVDTAGGRSQALTLTTEGAALVQRGIRVVDEYLFKVFADESRQSSLMGHIDMLLNHTKGVIEEQSNKALPEDITHFSKTKEESSMGNQIPKARELYRGDINTAVIQVQSLTGVRITPSWWGENVGNNGTSESILDRFDAAYARDFGTQIAAKGN
jgi:DNA-binding MarR family transcriptional regulator